MTTIAYKDGVIAVDSQGTIHETIYCMTEQKIWRRFADDGEREIFFVLSGNADDAAKFVDLWPDEVLEGGDCSGFVYDDGILYRAGFSESGKITRQTQDMDISWAFGSGMDYALGAMDMGASAEQAVKVAIGRDVFSGGEVKTVKLPVF